MVLYTPQDEYDQQLEILEEKLQASQDAMASPVEPTTMEQLKKQIAEHKVRSFDPPDVTQISVQTNCIHYGC